MPARSLCLVTLSLSEAGPGHFGGQVSVTDIYHAIPYQTSTSVQFSWHMLPSASMVDSVTGLRYAECSRAPHYITNGYGSPMQTTSCTWSVWSKKKATSTEKWVHPRGLLR